VLSLALPNYLLTPNKLTPNKQHNGQTQSPSQAKKGCLKDKGSAKSFARHIAFRIFGMWLCPISITGLLKLWLIAALD
jgi:hypothetical protein